VLWAKEGVKEEKGKGGREYELKEELVEDANVVHIETTYST
jgi:hypothetical protein